MTDDPCDDIYEPFRGNYLYDDTRRYSVIGFECSTITLRTKPDVPLLHTRLKQSHPKRWTRGQG